MESLYILVPLSVVLVFIAVWVFFKAADGGQFDDLVGPAMRVVQDDDRYHPPEPEAKSGQDARNGRADPADPPAEQ